MDADPKTSGPKTPGGDRKARQAVSDRLRRFYGTLLSGLEADADEFFRRVMEQKEIRDHEHVVSRL